MTEKYISYVPPVETEPTEQHSGAEVTLVDEPHKLGEYETGYDSKPTEEALEELYDILDLPDNPTERADEIVRQFTRGKDVAGFIQVIHQRAVPHVVTTPARHTMSSVDLEGNTKTEFAIPEERPILFEYAARKIAELAVMRSENNNEMEDQAFLDAVADIIALSSVFAHTYNDGNGRTSRIAGGLIRGGSKDRETLAILAKNRVDVGFPLDGYRPHNEGQSPYEILDSLVMKDLPLTEIYARDKRREQLISYPTTTGSIDTYGNVAKRGL